MKRLVLFAIAAGVLEVLALVSAANVVVFWLLAAIISLIVLYGVVLAVRGWRKQLVLDVPPVMTGRVVRKQHWRLIN
ncbi:MAG: hypothetical protein A2201_04340 [Alicyclobacillus sp. RIFOXYA1_FULL_53_8]|nr:MAG: hypothetical protein A2201_04340 [Alicyclobacillus sp. RIFOXYA1_FULL_53_8]